MSLTIAGECRDPKRWTAKQYPKMVRYFSAFRNTNSIIIDRFFFHNSTVRIVVYPTGGSGAACS